MDEEEPINAVTIKTKKKKRTLWTTTTIAGSLGREELLAATFKEIIFHLISLLFLSIYVFNQAASSEYYMTATMKTALNTKDMEDVISAESYWKYLQAQIMDTFFESPDSDSNPETNETTTSEYPERTTKTQPAKVASFMLNPLNGSEKPKSIVVFEENVVLGVPRMRQVKVTNNSCEIHGYFRRLFTACYYMFGSNSEDKSPFGSKKPTAWVYSEASQTQSLGHWGTLSYYTGGGFYVDLSTDPVETKQLLNELQDSLWITRGTRAVFIDFAVYNANLNVFCVCKLVFEFSPSGGVISTYKFLPGTFTPFQNAWYWILRIFLYMFCGYALYCLCEEVREMIYFGGEYFLQFWNYIDLTVIFLTCLLVTSTEYMSGTIRHYLEKIEANPNLYGNLETPNAIYQVVRISGAILLFFVYLRTFKYLNFNRRMAQLNNTLRNCAKDILGFLMMFFVAYFAFAELGYLVFGSEVEDFRSFGTSTFTLLRAILGDFNYDSIRTANWIVAPIYFLSYIILVFFVLLNMFLAIINDTYADVKTDIAIAPKEMEMSEYVVLKFRKWLGKLGLKMKEKPAGEMLTETNLSRIRDALVKCNFDDKEIEMYFTRYDIDPLKDMRKEDIEKFYDLFAQEDLARKRGEQNVVTWKDFQRQDDKLVELENSVVILAQRMNDLLKAIENVQGGPSRP